MLTKKSGLSNVEKLLSLPRYDPTAARGHHDSDEKVLNINKINKFEYYLWFLKGKWF